LGGNWTAWLSTATTDARDRIVDQPYRRLDGRLVATSLADLLDGSLRAPITLRPSGGSGYPYAASVHTATNADGTYGPSNFLDSDCSGWTSNTGTTSGGENFSEDRWTSFFGGSNCSNCTSLYCFEQ
jgi:hypothetical protein